MYTLTPLYHWLGAKNAGNTKEVVELGDNT
jgi:hypothetical protein